MVHIIAKRPYLHIRPFDTPIFSSTHKLVEGVYEFSDLEVIISNSQYFMIFLIICTLRNCSGGKLSFGKLPILEVDGKVLAQSVTILKYVARETGRFEVPVFC